MELNFEQAFSYMKADRHLAKKLAVGGILPWLCMFLFAIPIIVAYVVKDVALTIGTLGATLFVILLVALVMNGFVVQTINNRIHNKEEVLPDWGDFWNLALTGFKFNIGYLLYLAPIVIGSMITMIAFVPLGIDILVLKYIALMVLLIMIPVLCIFGFIYMLSCMLMIGNFSVDMKILDFVNFKKAYAHIRDNWANYLILLLLLIALSLILQVGAFILALTIVGVIIIPAFMFYMYLVSADLVAQFMKTKREE